MRNTNKTVVHIPKLLADPFLFLFHNRWFPLKRFTDLQKTAEMKENFALAKKTKILKN